jgi:hypothetical protein
MAVTRERPTHIDVRAASTLRSRTRRVRRRDLTASLMRILMASAILMAMLVHRPGDAVTTLLFGGAAILYLVADFMAEAPGG